METARSEAFVVWDVLAGRYYISARVPQPSVSSSNPDLHFKASKHQLLFNHNIFRCAFAAYCLYKYVKAVFKLSSSRISIHPNGDYGNFGSVFSAFSSANTQKSEWEQLSGQTKELKAM